MYYLASKSAGSQEISGMNYLYSEYVKGSRLNKQGKIDFAGKLYLKGGK